MTNAHMTHYQSFLLTVRVTFINLLPQTSPIHLSADILAEETGTQNDLKDQISLGLRTVASRLKVSRRRGQQYGGEQKASDLGQQPS